jgi:hypothetical protein
MLVSRGVAQNTEKPLTPHAHYNKEGSRLRRAMNMSGAEESAKKETEATTSKKNRFWEFVNSQFGLWLLGSVVLGGITWYWNYLNKGLDDRRKDSEFLVSMLPYLSSQDGDVRLRAASVVSARYQKNQVPDEVQRVVSEALGGVKANEQNQQTYNKVVMRLDKPIANTTQLDAAAASSAQDLPERVYIQFYKEGQREPARQMQKLLREQKFVVPDIQNVSGIADLVASTEVRYFNNRDQDAADRVINVVKQNGYPDAKLQLITKFQKNPGVLEVWLKP